MNHVQYALHACESAEGTIVYNTPQPAHRAAIPASIIYYVHVHACSLLLIL